MVPIAGGSSLKAHRRARGLSQAALAAAIGVRPPAVARWERGESAPDDGEMQRLAQALAVEPAVVSRWFEGATRGAEGRASSAGGSVGWGADPWTSSVPPDRLASGASLRSRLGMLWVRPPSGPTGGWAFPTRSSRRVVRSYLEDPAERRRYGLRLAATVVVMVALVLVLVWALGQLGGAWGSFLDLFHGTEPSPAPGGALLLLLPIL